MPHLSMRPVIRTTDLTDSSSYYSRRLDCRVVFKTSRFVGLRMPGSPGTDFVLLKEGATYSWIDARVAPMLVVEVDDIDAVFARFPAIEIQVEPRDEASGQRHFLARVPNGPLIEVVQRAALSEGLEPGRGPIS